MRIAQHTDKVPCYIARRWMKLAGIVAVVGTAGLATAQYASANVSHVYSGNVGSAKSTPVDEYPLMRPTDVAIDKETHDIYVADSGNYRVEKLTPTGEFILMFGKDVNETTGGNVCTKASGNTCQPGTKSSEAGGFEEPTSLAIDNYPGGEGDVYVGDQGDGIAQKFTSSGQLITTWGSGGQKNGADAKDLPNFGPVYGVAVGGGCATPESTNNGACSSNASFYVDGGHYNDLWEYTQSGTYIKWNYIGLGSPVKVDSQGDIFASNGGVEEAIPVPTSYQDTNAYQMTNVSPTTGFDIDFAGNELYQDTGSAIEHYPASCNAPLLGPCEPIDSFGEGAGQLGEAKGLAVDESTNTVYVANAAENNVAVFSDVRPSVITGAPTEASEEEVTLTGKVDPKGHGEITRCEFEYGFSQTYGTKIPCSPAITKGPGGGYSGPTEVTARITVLLRARKITTVSSRQTARNLPPKGLMNCSIQRSRRRSMESRAKI